MTMFSALIKIIIALIVASCVCGCKKTTPANVAVVSVDSLINNWNNSWNRHDSAAIRNMFDRNPVLVDDNFVAKDIVSISKNWIHPKIRTVHNLKTIQLQGWANEGKAGYLGTYTLDFIENDVVVAKPQGVISMSWKKTEEGKWKITNAHLHSFRPK